MKSIVLLLALFSLLFSCSGDCFACHSSKKSVKNSFAIHNAINTCNQRHTTLKKEPLLASSSKFSSTSLFE